VFFEKENPERASSLANLPTTLEIPNDDMMSLFIETELHSQTIKEKPLNGFIGNSNEGCLVCQEGNDSTLK
jgi:uncharacterized protein YfaQ (DUF2300 family)